MSLITLKHLIEFRTRLGTFLPSHAMFFVFFFSISVSKKIVPKCNIPAFLENGHGDTEPVDNTFMESSTLLNVPFAFYRKTIEKVIKPGKEFENT